MEISLVEHAPRGLYNLSTIAAFSFRSHFHLLNCHLSSGSFVAASFLGPPSWLLPWPRTNEEVQAMRLVSWISLHFLLFHLAIVSKTIYECPLKIARIGANSISD